MLAKASQWARPVHVPAFVTEQHTGGKARSRGRAWRSTGLGARHGRPGRPAGPDDAMDVFNAVDMMTLMRDLLTVLSTKAVCRLMRNEVLAYPIQSGKNLLKKLVAIAVEPKESR